MGYPPPPPPGPGQPPYGSGDPGYGQGHGSGYPPGYGQGHQPGYRQGYPQPGYGQGYPQPGYGPGHGYGHSAGRQNGAGIAALVLGILALLSSWFILGGLLGLFGLVFGIIGIHLARRGRASNMGVAISGVVLSVISILIAAVVALAAGWIFSVVGDCTDTAKYPTQAEQDKCVKDQLPSSGRSPGAQARDRAL